VVQPDLSILINFSQADPEIVLEGDLDLTTAPALEQVLDCIVRAGFPEVPGWGDPPAAEARALSALCAGVEVWSVYVPNGRAVGDPHFDYKLSWLEALRGYGAASLAADPDAQIVFCGDFNIAPTDDDVWSVGYYANLTHTTPEERAAFGGLVDAGFTDVVRPYTPGPGVYTYWDYTQLRFQRRQGMRIDFALASPALAARVTGASIDREERKGKGASDHAPVLVEIAAVAEVGDVTESGDLAEPGEVGAAGDETGGRGELS
jgi:exodeoxyribonuclease-3